MFLFPNRTVIALLSLSPAFPTAPPAMALSQGERLWLPQSLHMLLLLLLLMLAQADGECYTSLLRGCNHKGVLCFEYCTGAENSVCRIRNTQAYFESNKNIVTAEVCGRRSELLIGCYTTPLTPTHPDSPHYNNSTFARTAGGSGWTRARITFRRSTCCVNKGLCG